MENTRVKEEEAILQLQEQLLKAVIKIAKENKIKARITCGPVSIELGESLKD